MIEVLDTKTVFCETCKTKYTPQKINVFGREVETTCPFCEKRMLEKEEEKNKKAKEEQRMLSLKKANIEPMYFNSTLDNFETPTSELKKAKDYISKLIKGDVKKIVMLGKNGTGKTHLAVCAVKELGGQIKTVYEIATEIRASYSNLAKETELEIVDKYASLPMLAIDEIGRTKGSDAEVNWLSYIIDKRHTRELPLILISNKHMMRYCINKGCKDCLENYLGNDVMSRLAENAELLNFDGEDFRRSKRAKL